MIKDVMGEYRGCNWIYWIVVGIGFLVLELIDLWWLLIFLVLILYILVIILIIGLIKEIV